MYKFYKNLKLPNDKRVLIVIALFIVAMIMLYLGIKENGNNYYKDFIVGGIFPEMIGVVVDMVFVYLIFSYIEERRRKK